MSITNEFDLFLFDLDGVVYTGNEVTPYAREVIDTLRNNNKKILFVTNNPSKSPRQYLIKLKKIGISCYIDEIITSSLATSYYLTKKFKKLNQKTAYVVGSQSLKNEIKKIGIKVINGIKAHRADIVIVGGHSQFNYKEIKIASLAIRNGANFIATNKDPFYPSTEGLLPATGALLSSIETATEKKAIICGKPEEHIFDLCMKKSGLKNKNRAIIIGDNLSTDIIGGIKYGIKTVLVLSGSTKQKHLKRSDIKPDYIIKHLGYLQR